MRRLPIICLAFFGLSSFLLAQELESVDTPLDGVPATIPITPEDAAPSDGTEARNSLSDDGQENEPLDIESHVVKLHVTQRRPDFYRPWTKASPNQATGSGAILPGGRILTNAHVVSHASQVLVQLRKGGDKLPAHVVAVGPRIDLAVVELDDPTPIADLPGLKVAEELPEIKTQVSVYGYPTGGSDLSVTAGIVSRIEFTSYYYSGAGVRVQVDAALNSGNSGGPAIQNGEIAGLVFSRMREADNIGYLIPPEEISTFLEDIEDGEFDGKQFIQESLQSADNAALRSFLKLKPGETGVVVNKPYRDDADYPLKQWDVVTHVGPHSIDNQGFVEVRPGLRLRFLYYVPILADEGGIELTVIRDGEPLQVTVPTMANPELLIPIIEHAYPEYFIYGPLVFTTPSQESVRALGSAWLLALAGKESPIVQRMRDRPKEPGEQLVIVATQTFPHRITQGYSNRPFAVVDTINDKPVKNLRQMAQLLRDSTDEFIRIEFADRGESFVFRRKELEATTEEIAENEGIRYIASKSLRDIWDDE